VVAFAAAMPNAVTEITIGNPRVSGVFGPGDIVFLIVRIIPAPTQLSGTPNRSHERMHRCRLALRSPNSVREVVHR
jgi:hypothetical protein